jgi:multidrug efflux pump subunit AcrA (membrane-fusion protein)
MKDLIKALRESLKREQERDEALRKHIKNGGYCWGYSGYEFDKACDEAEDRLRQALIEAIDARLDELEVRVKALLQKERTEREAREIADSSGMSLGLARKFVTVGMTPEEEQATADRIRKSREAKQQASVSKPPPEDDVRC